MIDVVASNQGYRQGYFWLETWGYAFPPIYVARACPDVVVGKRVLVTAFDAGPLELLPIAFQDGWVKHAELCISPRVTDVNDLVCSDFYDEWYVFDSIPMLKDVKVYITYGVGFDLVEERVIREKKSRELLEGFWNQMKELEPISYLACHEYAFIFACREKDLFIRMETTCRRLIAKESTGPL